MLGATGNFLEKGKPIDVIYHFNTNKRKKTCNLIDAKKN